MAQRIVISKILSSSTSLKRLNGMAVMFIRGMLCYSYYTQAGRQAGRPAGWKDERMKGLHVNGDVTAVLRTPPLSLSP